MKQSELTNIVGTEFSSQAGGGAARTRRVLEGVPSREVELSPKEGMKMIKEMHLLPSEFGATLVKLEQSLRAFPGLTSQTEKILHHIQGSKSLGRQVASMGSSSAAGAGWHVCGSP